MVIKQFCTFLYFYLVWINTFTLILKQSSCEKSQRGVKNCSFLLIHFVFLFSCIVECLLFTKRSIIKRFFLVILWSQRTYLFWPPCFENTAIRGHSKNMWHSSTLVVGKKVRQSMTWYFLLFKTLILKFLEEKVIYEKTRLGFKTKQNHFASNSFHNLKRKKS